MLYYQLLFVEYLKIIPFQFQFLRQYHRCVIEGRESYIEQIALIVLPFAVVAILYSIMLVHIIRSHFKRSKMLLTSTLIIVTGAITYFPTIISNLTDMPMSYEVSMIFTVTFYYLNPILNPMVYVGTHPQAKMLLKSRFVAESQSGAVIASNKRSASINENIL